MIKDILRYSISLVCTSIANFAVCYALSTPDAGSALTFHENLSTKVAAEYLQTFAHEIIEEPQPLVTSSVQVLNNYKIRETIFLKILGRSSQLGVYEKESEAILIRILGGT